MKKFMIGLTLLLTVALSASAELTPVGSYDLTFSRTGWSQTATIPVTAFPTAATFYQIGGYDVNVYMQSTIHGDIDATSFTWYVNCEAVKNSPTDSLLGGTGPLTITISGLQFAEVDTSAGEYALFQPQITHIYYVDPTEAGIDVPGSTPTYEGSALMQRSPIEPLTPLDPDYTLFGPAYGTPYQDFPAGTMEVVLEDLYVPFGQIYEVSFGAGFTAVTPEPTSLLLIGFGLAALGRKRK